MLSQLVRDSAIYGGGDALARVAAFVIFPIIASSLGSEGFGILELGMTIVMLGGLFVRCGMNNAVQRYYWDSQTLQSQRPVLVSSGLAVALASGIVVSIFLYLAHPFMFRQAGVDPQTLGWYGVTGLLMLIPLTQWAQYVQDVLRLHFASWKFLGFSFATRALSVILSAGVLVFLQAGVGGVFLAQALVLLAALPVGCWFIRRDLVCSIDPPWIKRLVAFGAPFILTDMAFWLFSSIDRWMLAAMLGPHETGIYSAAFRISVLASFVSMAFGMAWSPYAVKLQAEFPTRFKTMYAEILILLLVVMIAVGGGVALFSTELVLALLPTEYAASAAALPFLAFCVIFQASQQVTAVGISMSGKSQLFAYLVWATAAINASINLPLIHHFGVAGAAGATLVSHLLLTVGYLVCSSYVYPIPYPIGRLLWLCLLGTVLLASALALQAYVPSIGLLALKLALLTVCLLLAWPTLRLRAMRQSPEK
jgi:O-antigen/teichoic acid export membrane protein